jgi:hypothetical protein
MLEKNYGEQKKFWGQFSIGFGLSYYLFFGQNLPLYASTVGAEFFSL